MEEIDFHNVRIGSRVKYFDVDNWVEGEVTIVNSQYGIGRDKWYAKVIFDSPSDLNYDYYPMRDLILVDDN